MSGRVFMTISVQPGQPLVISGGAPDHLSNMAILIEALRVVSKQAVKEKAIELRGASVRPATASEVQALKR